MESLYQYEIDDEDVNAEDDEFFTNEQEEIEEEMELDVAKKIEHGIAELIRQGVLNTTSSEKVLRVIRDAGIKIKLNRRTIMGNPKKVLKEIHPITGGEYIHIGVKENLERMFFPFFEDSDVIDLDISYDGVPVCKSSSTCAWVISAAFTNKRIQPFIVGYYYGRNSKPKNPAEFFVRLLNELRDLKTDGVYIRGVKKIVKVDKFVSDTPARQLATGTLGHAGKFACPYCTQKGKKIDHHMVYRTKIGAHKRTNQDFRSMKDKKHNK